MKHLFSGIALAALLAGGTPALAQSDSAKQPAAPSSATGTGASSQSGTTTPPGAMDRSKSAGTGAAAKHHAAASDNMAEQLNREELERVQHGGQTSGSGTSQAPAQPSDAGGAGGGGTSGTH